MSTGFLSEYEIEDPRPKIGVLRKRLCERKNGCPFREGRNVPGFTE
jgi:hypothetical protein